MTTHRMKCWPEYFVALADGTKNFEARRDDRVPAYAVGDVLHVVRWDPNATPHTNGEVLVRHVTYVLRDTEQVAPGYCIMGLVGECPHGVSMAPWMDCPQCDVGTEERRSPT